MEILLDDVRVTILCKKEEFITSRKGLILCMFVSKINHNGMIQLPYNLKSIYRCFTLCILVVVEMRPMTPISKFDNASELLCSIHYRGYELSAVNIFQQNTSGYFSILNVSRNGKVESKNTRINEPMTVSDDIINVTVFFDVSRGPGGCELNQTYSCNIQLVDTSIDTKAANSMFILESKYKLL